MAKYLYNGIELPALPSGDYPYWYIDCVATDYVDGITTYKLVNSKYPLYKNSKEGTSYTYTTRSVFREYRNIDGEWAVHISWEQATNSTGTPVVWSNFDIYYGDSVADVGGTLYLAASDPIPVVGEALPVSPYLRKNGAWQKQDTYKRVGGQWVKQPQEGYEMVEKVWQPIFEKVEEPTGDYKVVELVDDGERYEVVIGEADGGSIGYEIFKISDDTPEPTEVTVINQNGVEAPMLGENNTLTDYRSEEPPAPLVAVDALFFIVYEDNFKDDDGYYSLPTKGIYCSMPVLAGQYSLKYPTQ